MATRHLTKAGSSSVRSASPHLVLVVSANIDCPVTCIDPRCEPTQFLGPNHFGATIKNAGGHATPDAVRSILTLRSLVTSTSHKGTVAVVHHTGKCALFQLTLPNIWAGGARDLWTPTDL